MSVELTIKWNEISKVYEIHSTRQLIPFVIGLVRLLGLIYAVALEAGNRKACDSEGKSPSLTSTETHSTMPGPLDAWREKALHRKQEDDSRHHPKDSLISYTPNEVGMIPPGKMQVARHRHSLDCP